MSLIAHWSAWSHAGGRGRKGRKVKGVYGTVPISLVCKVIDSRHKVLMQKDIHFQLHAACKNESGKKC